MKKLFYHIKRSLGKININSKKESNYFYLNLKNNNLRVLIKN